MEIKMVDVAPETARIALKATASAKAETWRGSISDTVRPIAVNR
ncbi:hypothetical protein SAMN05216525_12952 [Bradyrhizobium sp. Gha]|nr:hypothetical protein SAMN05216525_12952 [Bradyrhizobium sp. Gha]